jgi:hypothetical protein
VHTAAQRKIVTMLLQERGVTTKESGTHDQRTPEIPIPQYRVVRCRVKNLNDLGADGSEVAHLSEGESRRVQTEGGERIRRTIVSETGSSSVSEPVYLCVSTSGYVSISAAFYIASSAGEH